MRLGKQKSADRLLQKIIIMIVKHKGKDNEIYTVLYLVQKKCT